MQIIDQLTHFIIFAIIVLLILCLLIGIILLVRNNNRKKRRGMEESDIRTLHREDVRSYVKIEDIRENMVILDYGTRFVGAIRGQGFDFFNAQETEKGATAMQFMAFIGAIDSPMTYRQHSHSVDMEDSIKKHEELYQKVEKQLFNLTEDRKDLVKIMKNQKDSLTLEGVKAYEEKIAEMTRQLDSLSWRMRHLKSELQYLHKYSGNGVMPEEVQLWIFEWKYNKLDFSYDLTPDEVYMKAKENLDSIAKDKIYGLSNAGVKAVRCTTEELIQINRKYSAPISADRYKLRDVLNSSYFDDIISSDDIYTMQKKAAQVSQETMENEMMDLLADKVEASEKEE